MASRLRRACLSSAAVVVAVVALPLLGAGAAQAAIAGASSFTTPGLPDLISATVVSTSTLQDEVQVCFDKAVNPNSVGFGNVAPALTFWHLVGYRSANSFEPTSVVENGGTGQTVPGCADLFFNAQQIGDIDQYTVLSVDAGAVANNSNTGDVNLADSVTLTLPSTDAGTRNGTAGYTTQPDLIGVTTPITSATAITFAFDQNIVKSTTGTGAIVPGDFYYQDPSGQICVGNGLATGTAQASSPSQVTITFPATCVDPNGSAEVATNAVRAGVSAGGVTATADLLVPNQSNEDVVVGVTGISTNPQQQGVTSIPDLAQAKLISNTVVAFVFDQQVNDATAVPSQFHVTLSDGTVLNGLTAVSGTSVSGNGQEVDVTFDPPSGTTFNNEDEYAVQAWVGGNAISDENGVSIPQVPATNGVVPVPISPTFLPITNSPGDTPIGGNTNGFARGFTTGPDLYAASWSKSTGVLTLDFDQRVNGLQGLTQNGILSLLAQDVHLITSDGAIIGAVPTSITLASTVGDAGPESVGINFGTAANADGPVASPGPHAVQLLAPNLYPNNGDLGLPGTCAFVTPLQSTVDTLDDCNVEQVVPLTVTASHLKAVKVTTHKVAKKQAKKAKKTAW